jgi:hypothetical protein
MDPLVHTEVQRVDVVCTMCGDGWDTRLVQGGSVVEDRISLCPSCLLTTSHGEPVREPYPQDPITPQA